MAKKGWVTLGENCWAGVPKTWAQLQEEGKGLTRVMRFSSQLSALCNVSKIWPFHFSVEMGVGTHFAQWEAGFLAFPSEYLMLVVET